MDYVVSSRAYNGSLLATQLFSKPTNLVLSSFGTLQTGQTLSDANGKLSVGESLTLGGTPYTMLGSGTVTPGITVLGATVALGSAVDVVIVQDSGGNLRFIYPEGTPNLVGALLLIVDVDPIGYSLVTGSPLCFTAGTRILTREGYRTVETLAVGDVLIDAAGQEMPLLWIGQHEQGLVTPQDQRHKPVEIAAHSFGPGLPERSLRLSPQHRVPISDSRFVSAFGTKTVLVPVKYLLDDDCITIVSDLHLVMYFHLLCPRHCLLVAEGMPAESLLQGPMAQEALANQVDASLAHISTQPCLPVLKRSDLRRLGYSFRPERMRADAKIGG